MKRSKMYRYYWEKHHGKKIPKGYHIHHIDGNKDNNSINNLLCVSPEEHKKLHEEMGHTILKSGFILKAGNRLGIPRSQEDRNKISKAKKGICTLNRTSDLNDKVSKSMGSKPFLVFKDGNFIGQFINLSGFCKKFNLNRRNVYNVLKNYPNRTVLGYNFKYLEK